GGCLRGRKCSLTWSRPPTTCTGVTCTSACAGRCPKPPRRNRKRARRSPGTSSAAPTGPIPSSSRHPDAGGTSMPEEPQERQGESVDPSILAERGLEALEQAMSTGGRYALDTAIGLLGRAADAMADDHPDRPMTLCRLGPVLRVRVGATGAPADLSRAVAVGRESVDCAAADDVDRPLYLSNLALALLRRFERAGRLEDLDQAIASGEEAVAASPSGDPNRNGYLSNLGHQLLRRFERAGDPIDLDRAVAAGQEAVDRTP